MAARGAIGSGSADELDLELGAMTSDDWFRDDDSRIKNTVPGSLADDEDDTPDKSGSRLRSGRRALMEREPSKGIPTLDEWMHFASRVLIKTATDYYIEAAFRGIDEDMLTDREVARIRLTDAERDRIARPFAELAYKSKWTRKHGRSIIAMGDSVDALVSLGMWYSRINRIAAKYRRIMNGQPPAQRPQARHAHPPQPAQNMQAPQPVQPQRGGDDERTGQSSQANGHDRAWRPAVNGTVIRGFDAS